MIAGKLYPLCEREDMKSIELPQGGCYLSKDIDLEYPAVVKVQNRLRDSGLAHKIVRAEYVQDKNSLQIFTGILKKMARQKNASYSDLWSHEPDCKERAAVLEQLLDPEIFNSVGQGFSHDAGNHRVPLHLRR
jgi:hypothetical protein